MKNLSSYLLAASLTTGTVFAAGSATTPSAPPATAPQALKAPMMTTCQKGFELKTLSDGKHKCVKVKTELTPDQELYAKGYKLAKAGDYEQAIAVLSSVENLSLIHISEPTRQAEISYAVFC